jgi:hypothetical protein
MFDDSTYTEIPHSLPPLPLGPVTVICTVLASDLIVGKQVRMRGQIYKSKVVAIKAVPSTK